jgi:hypothetical protein
VHGINGDGSWAVGCAVRGRVTAGNTSRSAGKHKNNTGSVRMNMRSPNEMLWRARFRGQTKARNSKLLPLRKMRIKCSF